MALVLVGPPVTIGSVATSMGPALVGPSIGLGLPDTAGLWATWKGREGDQSIWWSTFDGVSWAGQQVMPRRATSNKPSLTICHFDETPGPQLMAAWKAEDNDQHMYYARYVGGNWTEQTMFPENFQSSVGPSLAWFQKKVWAAWKGMDNDEQIWYAHFDGTSWSGKIALNGPLTSTGPSLLASQFRNTLYMAWKGENGDETIWWSTNVDGGGWSGQQVMPDPIRSSTGPSLMEYQNYIYVTWKGSGSDPEIWYTATSDGNLNHPNLDTAGTVQAALGAAGIGTSNLPTMAVLNSVIYFVWKGIVGDDSIWWMATFPYSLRP